MYTDPEGSFIKSKAAPWTWYFRIFISQKDELHLRTENYHQSYSKKCLLQSTMMKKIGRCLNGNNEKVPLNSLINHPTNKFIKAHTCYHEPSSIFRNNGGTQQNSCTHLYPFFS